MTLSCSRVTLHVTPLMLYLPLVPICSKHSLDIAGAPLATTFQYYLPLISSSLFKMHLSLHTCTPPHIPYIVVYHFIPHSLISNSIFFFFTKINPIICFSNVCLMPSVNVQKLIFFSINTAPLQTQCKCYLNFAPRAHVSITQSCDTVRMQEQDLLTLECWVVI